MFNSLTHSIKPIHALRKHKSSSSKKKKKTAELGRMCKRRKSIVIFPESEKIGN